MSQLVPYGCALHASVDFREKLYKFFQSLAKLAASQPGDHHRAASIAATLSQSRGIFKLFKWVNCIDTYDKSLMESDLIVARLSRTEAVLNTVVTIMQDMISLDKLCATNVLSKSFAWWMNFLDLLLGVLLAGIASYAIRRLQSKGVNSFEAERKLLLLRLELGVRIADTIQLLQETSVHPVSKRQLWSGPSLRMALLASLASASFATSGVAIKRWAALTPPVTKAKNK